MSDPYAKRPWLLHYDAHVPPSLTYGEKTFAEQFAETAAEFPEKTALVYLGRDLTYRQLDALSSSLARYLIDSGLEPGDVVGLHLPNLPAAYISVIAVQKAGGVSTGLSPLLTPHELEHQLNDSGARVVITVDVLFAKLAEVAAKTRFRTAIVAEVGDFLPWPKRLLGKLLGRIPTGAVTPLEGKTVVRFRDALRNAPAAPVLVKRAMDDVIFLMYTGGTTGLAKGAMLTSRSYMSNWAQVTTWLDLGADDVALSAFPVFHIAGLALGGFSLLKGATQICVPNPRDTAALVASMKAYRPTVVVNVPTIYFELMKRDDFRALDHSRLKWCLSAAAPFPREYFAELEGIIGEGRFLELYGMTETSPVTCCNPRHGAKKAGSIGMPLTDTEVKLVDPETGELAAPGEPGELAIRGPQLMKGYHGKPGETAHAIRDGWMFTGDIATMDDDGYLFLVDRLKDMVIVSGFKVFTRELDDALLQHPDVALAASVGVPDPERPGSERVAAAVVLKPGVDATPAVRESITAHLRKVVAPYKVPRQIEFVDELPTSGVGKILKREVKRRMTAGDPAPPR